MSCRDGHVSGSRPLLDEKAAMSSVQSRVVCVQAFQARPKSLTFCCHIRDRIGSCKLTRERCQLLS